MGKGWGREKKRYQESKFGVPLDSIKLSDRTVHVGYPGNDDAET